MKIKLPHNQILMRALLLTLLVLFALDATACTACVGDADDSQSKGVNAAIFVMLGGLGFLAMAIGALFFSFSRRMKNKVAAPSNGAEASPC